MGEVPAPPDFVAVGLILAPWGTGGEVKVQVLTDFPDRFAPGRLVHVGGRPLQIENSRPHKHHLLVKLASIDNAVEAEKLRGQELGIPHCELRDLPEDEYYAFQLLGLNVMTTDRRHLGRIVDILTTAANDVYIVRGERGQVLVPAIDDVVKSIDLEKREMTIEAIDGLLS